MSDDTSLLVSARPIIAIEGTDNSDLSAGLNTLIIEENILGLYRCEASVSNWGDVNGSADYQYFDRRTVDFGKKFKVKYGTDTLFDGIIMGIEAQFPEGNVPEITILAEDRFQDLRMTRRTRTFDDMDDAAILQQIASDHSLSPQINFSGPTHKIVAQVNESDLAFIRKRSRDNDVELWMDGDTLHAAKHSDRNAGPIELTYRGPLREFSVLADLACQRTAVVVGGWDVSAKAALSYEATESAVQGELSGLVSGASILSQKRGARKETLAHTVPFTQQEAQTTAESVFKSIARKFVKGVGVADTSGDLRVGAFVDLKSLGQIFSGKYYVSSVKHLFDAEKGIRTEFTAERPGISQ